MADPVVTPEVKPVVEVKPIPTEKSFTQEQVDEMIAKRLGRAKNTQTSDPDTEAFYREKFEKEAKMTSEERLAEQRKQWELDNKNERISINKEHATAKLAKVNISDEYKAIFINDVDDNKEKSLGRINNLVAILTEHEKSIKDKITAEFNSQSGNMNYSQTSVNLLQNDYNEAKKLGRLSVMSAITRNAEKQGIKIKP